MKTAIYPGSFDPVTYGHLDIIKRSAKFVDRLIVAAFINPNKKTYVYNRRTYGYVERNYENDS